MDPHIPLDAMYEPSDDERLCIFDQPRSYVWPLLAFAVLALLIWLSKHLPTIVKGLT